MATENYRFNVMMGLEQAASISMLHVEQYY